MPIGGIMKDREAVTLIALIIAMLAVVWLLTPTIIKRCDESDRAHDRFIQNTVAELQTNR